MESSCRLQSELRLTFWDWLDLAAATPNIDLKAPTPRLALRPREAALAFGIGERLLWSKTNAGEIPHLRIGKAIVYPVDLLRNWLAEQAGKGGQR